VSTKQNIIIEQGTTFHQDFLLLNANNEPLPVSGLTAKSQIRKSYTSNTVYDFEVTLTDGNLSLDMTAANTLLIEPNRYLYDIEVTTTITDQIVRIIEGIVTVTGNVTRE